MIYTNQRKRELNAALLSKLNNPESKKNSDGLYLFLTKLPDRAEELDTPGKLERAVPECVRPWNRVVPIFISMGELYLVAYVNRSTDSMRMAEEKMSIHRVYYVPGLTIGKEAGDGRI